MGAGYYGTKWETSPRLAETLLNLYIRYFVGNQEDVYTCACFYTLDVHIRYFAGNQKAFYVHDLSAIVHIRCFAGNGV